MEEESSNIDFAGQFAERQREVNNKLNM